MNAEARAKGIHIEIGVADGALDLLDTDVVIGDKFKLHEVLRNLISNALKFSPRNTMVSVQVGFCPTTALLPTLPNNHITSPASSGRGRNTRSIRDRFFAGLSTNSASNGRGRSTGRNSGSIRKLFMARLSRSSRVQNNADNAMNSPEEEEEMDIMGELLVVVTDHGVGISKENQKLLFQEGMQFDPENLQTGGGSGFGEYEYTP